MVESHLLIISVLKRILNPLVIVSTLLIVLVGFGKPIDTDYILLLILVFLVTSLVYAEAGINHCWQRSGLVLHFRDILMGWGLIISIILFFAYITELAPYYDRSIILTWFIITPVVIYGSHVATRYILCSYYMRRGISESCAIVGLSDLGVKLVQRLQNSPFVGITVHGFFDDRCSQRLIEAPDGTKILGSLCDVVDYVRKNNIKSIYITLPMVSHPRIMKLFDELRDTTVSIYFIPDIFVFDLLHARFDQIAGLPVISVRDTPMTGVNPFNKRVMDIVFSLTFLIVLLPLLLLIAFCIKLTSPGPVLFKQRRYGLHGEEILVYKFRSMTVCEDGDIIQQAQKNDCRITPFGVFLRRTSLDELPQLLNVIAGNMSLVGPRPHAVAHNELYRKLISGYMIRHKVKPGITGWAQIHGLRGETETVEKMHSRIEFDIDYIRNWSIYMDFIIILRTALVVVRNKNAY